MGHSWAALGNPPHLGEEPDDAPTERGSQLPCLQHSVEGLQHGQAHQVQGGLEELIQQAIQARGATTSRILDRSHQLAVGEGGLEGLPLGPREAREEPVEHSLVRNEGDAGVCRSIRASSGLMPTLKNGLIKGENLLLDSLRLRQDGPLGSGDGAEAGGGAMATLSSNVLKAGQLIRHQRGVGADSGSPGCPGVHFPQAAAAGPHRGPVAAGERQLQSPREKLAIL
jgi:hypothetical protein